MAALLLLTVTPALAQFEIMGSYNTLLHEDQPERIPGPALGDYLGLPINESARAFADAWEPSRLTVPEHQCRAHSSPYILRGPLNTRIWDERDPQTQQMIAVHVDISNFQQRRTIWLDGRPHPSPLAEHTWMGFSTGRWEGSTLVVTTTHIKQMWHRRNGLPQSDQVRLTERFTLHGAVLTYVGITEDPVYLTEPLVKTTNMLRNPQPLDPQQLLYPCSAVVELADQPRGAVPHYLPGTNPFLGDFAREVNLPEAATRGGAETMYPEFAGRLGRNTSTRRP
ncbi:MAG: hypothetical protein AB7G23_02130 [Vicinamibacterales bacterium]